MKTSNKKTKYKEYRFSMSHELFENMFDNYIKQDTVLNYELPKNFKITGFSQSYEQNKQQILDVYFTIEEKENYDPNEEIPNTPEYVDVRNFCLVL